VRVAAEEAQVPFTSLFERRMSYWIPPNSDDWRMLDGQRAVPGVTILSEPTAPAHAAATPHSATSTHVLIPEPSTEVPERVLDVVLVPGVTHDVRGETRRRFFWEDNGASGS
jgi:hypothetical protein